VEVNPHNSASKPMRRYNVVDVEDLANAIKERGAKPTRIALDSDAYGTGIYDGMDSETAALTCEGRICLFQPQLTLPFSIAVFDHTGIRDSVVLGQ